MKLNRHDSQMEKKIDVLLREVRLLSSELEASPNNSFLAGTLDGITAIIEELRAERSEIECYTRTTNELLMLLYTNPSRKEYLDGTVLKIREWSGCKCVGIRVFENGAIPYQSHVGFSKRFWKSENNLVLSRDKCICTRVVAGTTGPQDLAGMTPGGSFRSNSTETFQSGLSEEARSLLRGVCIKSGFRSIAIIPIRHEDETIGAIHIADRRPNKIGHGFIAMMEFLAPLIGEAISKLTIRDRLERELELQKKSEAELQQRRDELAHLSRVVAVGEIATSLAHELNQPLSAILTNSQAALRFLSRSDPDLDEVRDALEEIMEDDLRASGIIKRLRSMLKKVHPERIACHLGEIIQDTLKLVGSDAAKRQISLVFEKDPDLPKIMGDPVQLQQILLNLILNACDAIEKVHRDNRRIIIRCSHNGSETVEVSVTDTGAGLDSGEMCCIFTPFYTTKSEGLGMGLPISRSIVEAHGGRLWATRNPDCGMTFSFSLPVGNSK